MRLPLLLTGLGLSVAIVGAALLLVRTTDPGTAPAGAAENMETAHVLEHGPTLAPNRMMHAQSAVDAASPRSSATVSAEPDGAETKPIAADPHSAYVEKRTAELDELAMQDDPASLKAIVAELANPDAQIRKAALDAAVQFGSRDAIPDLAAAAERATEVEEKKAILDAIEFLKLPSLTEVLQQRRLGNGPRSQPATVPLPR